VVDMTTLLNDRKALTDTLADCDPDAFPGSREWMAASKAGAALAAFDAAHPEVLAHLRGAPSDGVARALRGED
jgi:hypothetical protein